MCDKSNIQAQNDIISFYNSSASATPAQTVSRSFSGQTYTIMGNFLLVEFTTNANIVTSGWNVAINTLISGTWTDWTDWSTCSGSCVYASGSAQAISGTQNQTRSCMNSSPSTGIAFCSGNSTNFRTCSPTCTVLSGTVNDRVVSLSSTEYINGVRRFWFIDAVTRTGVAGYRITRSFGGTEVTKQTVWFPT